MLWYNDGPVPTTYPGPTGLMVPRCWCPQLSQLAASMLTPIHPICTQYIYHCLYELIEYEYNNEYVKYCSEDRDHLGSQTGG